MTQSKYIPEYEGKYKITSLGQIISFNSQDNKVRILNPHLDKYGYPRAILSVRGIRKGFTLHRLVAKAFIPNPFNLPQVNHINGIKTDNRVENLEWCTNLQNYRHAVMSGLKSSGIGESNQSAKLKESDVLEIRRLKEEFKISELSEKFKVHYTCIYKILKRQTWKHI